MTDDDVRQMVRELYYQYHGIFPTDEQLAEFVGKELAPAILLWRQQNESK